MAGKRLLPLLAATGMAAVLMCRTCIDWMSDPNQTREYEGTTSSETAPSFSTDNNKALHPGPGTTPSAGAVVPQNQKARARTLATSSDLASPSETGTNAGDPQAAALKGSVSKMERAVNDSSSTATGTMLKRPHPIWIPSFPGSGAEMTIQIINAITADDNMWGRDVYSGRCSHEGTATCKTHYPFLGFKKPASIVRPADAGFHDKAFLLLRCPLQSLPSLGNFVFETRREQSGEDITKHTTKAPEGWWRKWRDENFERRWAQWLRMIRFWHNVEKSPVKGGVAVYLAYEQWTHPGIGPLLVESIARELQAANIATKTDLRNQWEQVVLVKASKKRKSVSYTPRFTAEQLRIMADGLDRFMREFHDASPQLLAILQDYRRRIEETTNVDEPYQPRIEG